MRDEERVIARSASAARIDRLLRRVRVATPLLLRRHAGLILLLIVAAAIRVVVQATYWPAEFNADSHDYMQHAFTGLLHPTFDVIRPSGYSLFMAAVPGWKHLWTITVVQHLLGLLAGAAVYATALRWRVPRWGALLAAAVVLLDPLELALEQFILADTMAAFLVLGACVALAWAPKVSIPRAAAAGAFIATGALFRTAAAPLLAVGLAAVLVAGRQRLRATAVFLAVSGAILGSYVVAYHSQHGSYSTTSWGSRFLYGRIGLYVDCDRLKLPADETQVCPYGVPTSERTTNLFLWQTDAYLHRLVPPPGKTKDQVLADFDRRALLQQPIAYIKAVASDTLRAFQPTRARSADNRFDRQWHLTRRHQVNLQTAEAKRLLADGMTIRTWTTGTRWLTAYDRLYTPGPLLAVLLLAALASLLRPRRAAARPRLPVALTAATAVILTIVPAASASFSWRYMVAQLTLIPLAGAVGLRQILDRSTPTAPADVA